MSSTVVPESAVVHPASVLVTIALCFGIAVLEGFDIQAMGVAAPRFGPEFGFTPGQMGWIFSICNIGLVIGASLGGWFADRLGRKPVFMASVATFGLFTLLTTQATNFETFFIVRLLAGFGFGGALPNMMAVAAEISAPDKRATTAAAMFCGMPLGGGISALVTQVLPAGFDWRLLFVLGGVLPMLLVPAMYLWMPETLRRTHAKQGSGVSTFTALFGESRAVVTLLLWLTFLPTLLILYLILNWLPTLAVSVGLDAAVAPRASLVFNFASVVGALLFGRIVDRRGARWPLGLAYAALIVVLLGLAYAREMSSILVYSAGAGFFLMGANYSLYGVAASYYPTHIRGTGSGASIAVGRIGSVIGPMLGGMLLAAGMGATGVLKYLMPAAALAGSAVFALSYCRRAD